MERYHYSRYDLGDESGVREFLTRIDDEEIPSYILPGEYLLLILYIKLLFIFLYTI